VQPQAVVCPQVRALQATLKRETTVPLDWIAERLPMGARSTVSREMGALGKSSPCNKKLSKLYRKRLEA